MRYRRLAPDQAPEREPALGTPDHERLMLLELAGDLQSWPARNVVFEKALDRAAQELARMASETAVR
jgi:hypothetical protein